MPVATDRQTALLDEVVEVLLEEGFLHLTLDDIAARLGCSIAALHVLGKTEELLVAAAVHRFAQRTAAQVERRARVRSGATEQLASYLEGLAEALRPASAQFVADLAAHGPAREAYRRHIAAATRRLSELIDDGVRDGTFRAVSAAFVADVVATTLERISSGRVHARTGLQDAEAFTELAALLLVGIRS